MSEQLSLRSESPVMHYSSLFYMPVACGAEKPFDGPLVSTGSLDCVSCSDCLRVIQQPTRDSEIANLEWAVVEAAVARRRAQVPFKKISVYELAWNAENDAIDALIAMRESVEKENNGKSIES